MPRPREFEPAAALADLMNVFWERGYEGTSMQDIEAATGLKKQSLYRAFGDKRAMYLAALVAYEQGEVAAANRLLSGPPDARALFGRLLRHVIDRAVKHGDRRGCFLCNASVDQAPLDPKTAVVVQAMMARTERSFAQALARCRPYDTDHRARRRMARKLLAGYFGLRVLIKAGVPKEVLNDARSLMLAELRPPDPAVVR